MYRKLNPTGFLLVLFLIILSFFSCREKTQVISNNGGGNEKYDGAAKIQEREYLMTRDPFTGEIPREELYAAMLKTEELKQTTRTTGTWVERGPTSDIVGPSNGNTRANSGITSGRIRAIWVDLKDATGKTVWVGGVNGGLWKTTDITVTVPNWTLINDFFSNMAITGICQDPVNKDIMYFCTGEAFFNSDAVAGDGVFKSIDGGVSWTKLTSLNGISCTKILCDAAGNVYLGTQLNGLQRSLAASGGAVWTIITPSGSSARISDFEISSTGRLHVATGLGNSSIGLYRYTDIPATVISSTWTTPAVGFPHSSGVNARVELGCSGNVVYALPSDNGNPDANVATIYKSTNGGANWAATGSTPNFTSGQAWYCLAVDINPANTNEVIVGSLDCYKTVDGGANWTKISAWVGTAGQYVHADQQAMRWYDNGNKIIMACDGGIHYSSDGGTTWRDRNTNLRLKQFYSVAVEPTTGSNVILAGAQDNGVHRLNGAGLTTSVEVTGGDGAFVAIDQNAVANEFGSYVYNIYRRSTNTGASWSTFTFRKGTAPGTDFGGFINAFDFDNTNKIMYCGGDANEYFRWSDPLTRSPGTYYSSTTFGANATLVPLTLGGGFVSAVTVSPFTNHQVYFGSTNGRVVKTTTANATPTQTDITPAAMAAGYVSCINTGTNDQNLIACLSNYGVANVFVSGDGGTSWTALDQVAATSLPNIPVRWCMFVPGTNNRAIIATETGIWISGVFSGNTTTWTPSSTFPTVRTDMIKYRASDGELFAATHGRGLWSQNISTVVPINNFLLKGKWKTKETVELVWENLSVYPVNSYEIESSTDGRIFSRIGTTSSLTFTDRPSASNLYYRIKSNSNQGGISYSNVINLKNDRSTQDLSDIKIFPNPVTDYINLAYSLSGNGKVSYSIRSINGQMVWNKEEDISLTGDYQRKWNINSLKPGTYVLTILFNDKKVSQSFSKQ